MSVLGLRGVDEAMGADELHYQLAPGHGRVLPFNGAARYLATPRRSTARPATWRRRRWTFWNPPSAPLACTF